MRYQKKPGLEPSRSGTFHSKELLGKVKENNVPQIEQICSQQPPPHRQKRYNPKTNKTEPIKPNGEFYKPGEPRARLIKCTEWTLERAVPALQAAGILEG